MLKLSSLKKSNSMRRATLIRYLSLVTTVLLMLPTQLRVRNMLYYTEKEFTSQLILRSSKSSCLNLQSTQRTLNQFPTIFFMYLRFAFLVCQRVVNQLSANSFLKAQAQFISRWKNLLKALWIEMLTLLIRSEPELSLRVKNLMN